MWCAQVAALCPRREVALADRLGDAGELVVQVGGGLGLDRALFPPWIARWTALTARLG